MWWIVCIIIAIAFPPAIVPMGAVFLFYYIKFKNEESSNKSRNSYNNYSSKQENYNKSNENPNINTYTSSSSSYSSAASKNCYKHFNSKVVGVTVDNRQQIAKNLYAGQTLKLVREPYNSYDKNAIAILAGSNKIGYLSKEIASSLAYKMDEGTLYYCKVSAVTGGGSYNYGVNIKIDEYDIEVQCKNCGTNCLVPFEDNFTCPDCKELLYDTNNASSNVSNKPNTYNSSNNNTDVYDDIYEDDYSSYHGSHEISDCDYEPGDSAPWDTCDADPDMCCGYDH